MMKNTIEDYKAGIRGKYEVEKNGNYSNFLLNPSRARLRNLCALLFSNNTSTNDLKSFSVFFQFDFAPSCSNKLKEQTDKFRPIETFLKGETDLSDLAAVNIAAILVDFQPRPFYKFSKKEPFTTENSNRDAANLTDNIENDGASSEMLNDTGKVKSFNEQAPLQTKKAGFFRKKQLLPALLVLSAIGSFGYIITPKKDCMQWQKDHYEAVVCEAKSEGILEIYTIIPANEAMLTFRKINVCDTTTFFRHNKPVVWYSKSKNKLEFFNGPGFNPENGKPLKPITPYMIDKYVKSLPKGKVYK